MDDEGDAQQYEQLWSMDYSYAGEGRVSRITMWNEKMVRSDGLLTRLLLLMADYLLTYLIDTGVPVVTLNTSKFVASRNSVSGSESSIRTYSTPYLPTILY